jgi:protein-tyrosine phosphatase
MRAELYWIEAAPGRHLAVMPRPRAGDWLEDEVASWRQAGLDVIVSLLEPAEVAELGLAGEEAACRAAGLEFLSFAIADRGVPASRERFAELIARLEGLVGQGRRIGIHCRIGVGRSALVAACLLARLGLGPAEAFALVGRARGLSVPDTAEQVRWVEAWCAAA